MAVCQRCKGTGYCQSCGGKKPCHCPLGREKTREINAKRMKNAKANQKKMATGRKVNRRTSPMVQSFIPKPGGKK